VKVAVLQFFSWPERRVGLETVYERAFQRIELMDRSGYDAVWLAEHHFTGYSVCPSVHLMGMHVASRTRNLRIGTAVSLAAFYHPLRLAEEVALLDVLSGGRVNWGAGRGFDRNEFVNFGVPPDESYPRFREHVEIVLEAWKQDRLSYHGRYFDFDAVEVLPKPLQKPHPPMWVAASSPPAIEWAAERGYSIMMDPHSSHADIARKRQLYRSELEKHGHSIAGRDIPMARLLAVAESRDEAEQIARRGAQWLVGSYMDPKHEQVGLRGGGFLALGDDPVNRYLDGVVVWGTPDEVADELLRLREEMSLDYLLCAPLSHGSFALFTDRVLPRIASTDRNGAATSGS
jgi:alkanesulfonate monooxygenase SsuD/methylene tetrahydromethanopterin reductase-like flavin-dependent oxidoreductase (luciferase family)